MEILRKEGASPNSIIRRAYRELQIFTISIYRRALWIYFLVSVCVRSLFQPFANPAELARTYFFVVSVYSVFFSRPFPSFLIKLIRRCCETRYLFARSCWLKIISFDLINLCIGLINVYRWIKINHRNKKSRETLKKNFVIGTSMRNLAFAAVAYLLFSPNIFVFFSYDRENE